eukprot:TRINITY_DN149_c2_g2_i2.p1 TRINITY_DN149_c2_g2~~TRINITY_DN149_c2_g2_i2.p1  ORF type:complete len:900 (+),score=175.98 TRINITY_DN149_c2_g2_i2:37-2700(+)
MGAQSSMMGGPESLGADGKLPPPDGLTHESVFSQHSFPFGKDENQLLSTDCYGGNVKDPVSGKDEAYLTVGLRTKFDGKGVRKYGRPRLNLVVVIDSSGPMNGSLQSTSRLNSKIISKLDAAKHCIVGEGGLISQMNEDDQIAIVAFHSESRIIQPLTQVKKIVPDRVEALIEKIVPVGDAGVSSAMETAIKLISHEAKKEKANPFDTAFKPPSLAEPRSEPSEPPLDDQGQELKEVVISKDSPTKADNKKTDFTGIPPDTQTTKRMRRADTMYCKKLVSPVENRILVLSGEDLCREHDPDHEKTLQLAVQQAEKGIHSTFVGVGVGYCEFVVNRINAMPGCSALSVLSEVDLRHRVVDEFQHFIFPIAYDVSLTLRPSEVLPEPVELFGLSESGTEILHISSVFAGESGITAKLELSEEAKCSIGVARYSSSLEPQSVDLTTTFTDRLGERHSETQTFSIGGDCSSPAFRKTVLLTQMVSLLRIFLLDEHNGMAETNPSITKDIGIPVLPDVLRLPKAAEINKRSLQRSYSDDNIEEAISATSSPICKDDTALLPKEGDDEPAAKVAAKQPIINPAWPSPKHVDGTTLGLSNASASQLVAPLRRSFSSSIKQNNISDHYKAILDEFADHLKKENESFKDPVIDQWIKFIVGVTHYVSAETVEATCEQYLTARVIYGGSDPETIFNNLNAERFDGRLIEHHSMIVHAVFTRKMQSAIMSVINGIVEARPSWVIFNDSMMELVKAEVRKVFLHLESEAAHQAWLEKWGSLLETSLRTCLHGRVFSVCRQQYAVMANEGSEIGFEELTNKAMMEIAQICPEFKTYKQDADYSQSNEVSCQIQETRTFITSWILPILMKHSGECRWSLERGLPVPLNEDDIEPVAACPTQ